MSSPAIHIANILEAQDVCDVCYIAQEPTEPNLTVTVYDTGGAEYSPEPGISTATVQIRVRALTYLESYEKQILIRDTLKNLINFEIDGKKYIGFWQSSDIFSLGRDDSQRYITTSNYRVERF
jgi:hypothetical protein